MELSYCSTCISVYNDLRIITKTCLFIEHIILKYLKSFRTVILVTFLRLSAILYF